MDVSIWTPHASSFRGSECGVPGPGMCPPHFVSDWQSGCSIRNSRGGGELAGHAGHIFRNKSQTSLPLKLASSLAQRGTDASSPPPEPRSRISIWPASQRYDIHSQRSVSAGAHTDRQSRRSRTMRGDPLNPTDPRINPQSNDSQLPRIQDSEYMRGDRGGWERERERGGPGGGGGGWDYDERGGEDGDEEKPGGEIVLRGVNKFVLASVFTIGIGAGVAFSTVVNLEPTNVASRDVIDQKTPNPDVCLANGMSAMVLDQRLFISFNPFNVYVSQAEVKPGCVLRQSNWQVLESRGLVNSDEVRDCKRNMNTFGFVGDLRQAPEISCLYHSETAENQFLKDPAKAALGDGFQPKNFRE